MNRADFQWLANERIAESEILLAAGKWSGAYYLAGYAVECALKACICKLTKADDFPDKKVVNDSWKHDLPLLLDVVKLEEALKADAGTDSNQPLLMNWKTLEEWNESGRYIKEIAQQKAERLFGAITDQKDGILTWLKKHW